MEKEVGIVFPAVNISFWVALSKKEKSPMSATASLASEREGISCETTPDSLSQLRLTPERPVKRARTDHSSTMIDAPINDEVSLCDFKPTDKKPAAKLNLYNLDRKLRHEGHNLDARRALINLAEQCPDIFSNGTDRIPQQVNARAARDLNEILINHSDNYAVQSFVENCFAPMIRRFDQCSVALVKRDALIKKMITAKPVNPAVLAMLQDSRLHGVIFPDRTYRHDDLAKLILMKDMVSTGNPAHYEFLVSHVPLIEAANLKAERLQYVIAVAAKRIAGLEEYDVPTLVKMGSLKLAQELIRATAPNAYERAMSVATIVMDAAKKSKSEMGARLLAFLAENPALINKLYHVMHHAEKKVAGEDILPLLDRDKARINFYSDCLRESEHAIESTIVSHPLLLKFFSAEHCVQMTALLREWRNGSIDHFYAPEGDKTIVNVLAEVILRQTEVGACVANTAEDRSYLSVVHAVNKALYHAFINEGALIIKSDTVTHALIGLHRDLGKSRNSHSEERLTHLTHQGRVLKELLKSERYPVSEVLELVTNHYSLIKHLSTDQISEFMNADQTKRSLIMHYSNPDWLIFAPLHLLDLVHFSYETLRELVKVFKYSQNDNLQVRGRTLQLIVKFNREWGRFKAMDDIDKQRFLQRAIAQVTGNNRRPLAAAGNEANNPILQRVGQIGIHGQHVTSMVESTLTALLNAFSKAGWPVQSSAGAGGKVVIEAIRPEILEQELANFKIHLENDLIKKAAALNQQQLSSQDIVPLAVNSREEATRVHEKAYAKVQRLAKEVETIKSHLRQLKTNPKSNSEHNRVMERSLKESLIQVKASFNALDQLTKPYGALQYLYSKHLESDPKSIGRRDDKITLKQLLGAALVSSHLSDQHVSWHEGLDTQEKRKDAVYERLTEALHDSHTAYLGTRYQGSNSCWDGGVNRIMLAVRTLIDFNVMPSSADFAAEFHRMVINNLECLATPEFLNDTSPAATSFRQRLNQQMISDHRAGNADTVSKGLFRMIKDRLYASVKQTYPQITASPENRNLIVGLLKQTMPSVKYIQLPQSFVNAYLVTGDASKEDNVTRQNI